MDPSDFKIKILPHNIKDKCFNILVLHLEVGFLLQRYRNRDCVLRIRIFDQSTAFKIFKEGKRIDLPYL
jgi:hypothetical protein